MALRFPWHSRIICIWVLSLTFVPRSTVSAWPEQASSVSEDSRRKAALDDYGVFSNHYVLGTFECRKFPKPGAVTRCEAFEGCEERGEKFYREQLKKVDLTPLERILTLEKLALLYSNSADRLSDAIGAMSDAVKISRDKAPEMLNPRLAQLGILQLRQGELQNCIQNHNSESCIFPLSAKAHHKDVAGARAAKQSFLEYLHKIPNDAHIRWLLNIAAMALGEYPAKVPNQFLLPPQKNEKGSPQLRRFRDIAGAVGLQERQFGGGGVTVDDFNGDGLLDIVLTPKLECQPTSYFENDGKGGFVDKSKDSGLAQQLGVRTAFQGDFNNDGLLDLYLTRGTWVFPDDEPKVRYSLMKGIGKGKFIDVTEEVGLKQIWNAGGAANWVDFDKDGWLDLFVCNLGREVELFKNEKGHFRNVAKEMGIENKAFCRGSAWGDINGDGWPDLYIANFKAPKKLYLNQGGRTFIAEHQSLIEQLPVHAYTPLFFDVDNDGDLDLLVNASIGDTNEYARALFAMPYRGETSRLFKNDGDGKFTDVTEEYGLGDRPSLIMGANYGDLNGDGYLDLYLGEGSMSLGDLVPHQALLNIDGKRFIDVTRATSTGNLQKGHGLAFADLENRGNQDIVAANGGGTPSDQYFPALYKNPGAPQSWVTLKLIGNKSNRAAMGARVRVRVVERGNKRRDIYKTASTGGTYGANPLRVEIGLGEAKRISEVEIEWPNRDRDKTKLQDVPMNRVWVVEEGKTHLQAAKAEKIKLRTVETGHRHHLSR